MYAQTVRRDVLVRPTSFFRKKDVRRHVGTFGPDVENFSPHSKSRFFYKWRRKSFLHSLTKKKLFNRVPDNRFWKNKYIFRFYHRETSEVTSKAFAHTVWKNRFFWVLTSDRKRNRTYEDVTSDVTSDDFRVCAYTLW